MSDFSIRSVRERILGLPISSSAMNISLAALVVALVMRACLSVEAATAQTSELSVDNDCPPIADTIKLVMRVPQSETQEHVPSNDPVVLSAPAAYLSERFQNLSEHEMIYLFADYDTLQPQCRKGAGSATHGDILMLSVTRSEGPKDAYIASQVDRAVKNRHLWKKVPDSSLPTYDHYFKYGAYYFREHMLVPKDTDLPTPYFITCLKPKDGKNPQIVGECDLFMDYKHRFLVKAHFAHEHLNAVAVTYRKAVQLLDSFSSDGKSMETE